ncbi:branched-chain-amino-acid transaminase bat2 [Mycoemilia scoparia]|uniref:branched-chain-amino-acid transaminase n=1 Tax=Mycoemilia scoparia TaxID=417184 RepID=A0A9W7ZZ58_9FUNG|nr:branched-chain-amino-acid transaminase bat2 [Mycoemilia scoparia]
MSEALKDKISITLNQNPKPLIPKEEITFGKYFTDHMLEMRWSAKGGWKKPEIKPYGPLMLDPASLVLHYGLECFEGMKAYRKNDGEVVLFRPEMNMKRLNTSAERLMLPTFDTDLVLEGIKELVRLDSRWIYKDEGYSLYIRPTMIGSEATLNMTSSGEAILYVICCPVGPYFGSAVTLLANTEDVRAWPGGVGSKKVGGNYAPCIKPAYDARAKGADQVLWLLGDDHKVTEAGTMNFMVYWINSDGDRELITAPLDGTILPGITRDSLLHIAGKIEGVKVTERIFTMSELIKAQSENRLLECFGCGTACIVSPVKAIIYDSKTYKVPLDPNNASAQYSPLARKLYDQLLFIQYGKSDEYQSWTPSIKL